MTSEQARSRTEDLHVGWAAVDITPEQTVAIQGQFPARVSEGVMDPLTATALALESGQGKAVFVSCDLISITPPLREAIDERLRDTLDPDSVVVNATHTHAGPQVIPPSAATGISSRGNGVDLPIRPVEEYIAFAAERISDCAKRAWAARAPGKVAWGLGYAVVGRNRRWVDRNGTATMYGNTDTPDFSHVEGYEDHSVNVLATYDSESKLTGVIVNVPCPSQVTGFLFEISADYWHETRQTLRSRLGEGLFVLPQCSAAGDQSPRPVFGQRAEERMLKLSGLSARQTIANRISDAVTSTLDVISHTAAGNVVVRHHVEHMDLPLNELTEAQVNEALAEEKNWEVRYKEELAKLEKEPELRDEKRWYLPVTQAFRRAAWFGNVAKRFEEQTSLQTDRRTLHFVRIGDVAFATNPFEYYLDFGMHIKCRSKALQTFLVQLAGGGSYVPTSRSTAGGGYGSVPASNPFGPEAGRMVAERSVEVVNGFFE